MILLQLQRGHTQLAADHMPTATARLASAMHQMGLITFSSKPIERDNSPPPLQEPLSVATSHRATRILEMASTQGPGLILWCPAARIF